MARIDLQVQRDGDHVDEAAPDTPGCFGALLTRDVDFGQDFHRTAVGGNHPDSAPRTKPFAAMLKDTAAAPARERRRRRHCRDAIGSMGFHPPTRRSGSFPIPGLCDGSFRGEAVIGEGVADAPSIPGSHILVRAHTLWWLESTAIDEPPFTIALTAVVPVTKD